MCGCSTNGESDRVELFHNIDPAVPPKGVALPGSPFDVRTMASLRQGDWKIITGNAGMTSLLELTALCVAVLLIVMLYHVAFLSCRQVGLFAFICIENSKMSLAYLLVCKIVVEVSTS
jgi:hypothetical protein